MYHSLPVLLFFKYFCFWFRFIEFSLKNWMVVFLSFSGLSSFGLFCECCRMPLLFAELLMLFLIPGDLKKVLLFDKSSNSGLLFYYLDIFRL